MHKDQEKFSLFERLGVVSILLLVAAIAQNVWHEVKKSEVRTVTNAADEYEVLKEMYPEEIQTLPPSVVRMNASGAAVPHNAPIN
jgi:hypothetical protein